jgi:release factor glutamine methyltransferase
MTQDAWTIGRLLTWTTDYLKGQGVESPRLEAEVLLAHAQSCPRIQLYTEFDHVAEPDVRETYRDLVKRRAAGTPVAYLVGHREFYSLDFRVTSDVLIPRPETEFVVVTALDLVKQHHGPEKSLSIADVGTGSGVLAVCLAKTLTAAHVLALDISPAALDVAQQNARQHGVNERTEWRVSDLLEAADPEQRFDLIVSNPPYVSTAEWEQLAAEVRDHEPHSALVAGPRGDEIIQRLVQQTPRHLAPGGWLLIEISPMLSPRAADWFPADGTFSEPTIVKDLRQLPRVVVAQRL